ncbi:hypothetical protein JKP88DRAFT_216921 [Tribonema minus]|uniref:Uncharacterized protein n=1 Tax=Tribonema minus TaxID=303371 RepID=A0A836CPI1_9STRA|nr:hypothetical protein JKP88DRAFT_216921 [Tribonema minus]
MCPPPLDSAMCVMTRPEYAMWSAADSAEQKARQRLLRGSLVHQRRIEVLIHNQSILDAKLKQLWPLRNEIRELSSHLNDDMASRVDNCYSSTFSAGCRSSPAMLRRCITTSPEPMLSSSMTLRLCGGKNTAIGCRWHLVNVFLQLYAKDNSERSSPREATASDDGTGDIAFTCAVIRAVATLRKLLL